MANQENGKSLESQIGDAACTSHDAKPAPKLKDVSTALGMLPWREKEILVKKGVGV